MPGINELFINNLLGLLPSNEDHHISNRMGFTSDRTGATALYKIWRDSGNKISNTLYKRPVTVSDEEVIKMEKAGLVKRIADNLEVTDRGKKVIRVMVLGNDRSVFDKDDDGRMLGYDQAFAKTQHPGMKSAKKKGTTKTAESKWWDRFE